MYTFCLTVFAAGFAYLAINTAIVVGVANTGFYQLGCHPLLAAYNQAKQLRWRLPWSEAMKDRWILNIALTNKDFPFSESKPELIGFFSAGGMLWDSKKLIEDRESRQECTRAILPDYINHIQPEFYRAVGYVAVALIAGVAIGNSLFELLTWIF